MNSFLKIILVFIFITSCSLSNNSKFWVKKTIIEENTEEVFNKKESLSEEFNQGLKINLSVDATNKSFLNNLDNNNGRTSFNGNLQSISKYKFSKIEKFHQYDPKVSIYKNNIIFFNNKGSILRFNSDSKLIWKKNNYSKVEIKQKPILFFANNEKTLIVADTISKYYALNINTGELLWSKNNIAPFNSQLKIYNNKFFVIDFKNTLRAYSIKNGNEIWNVKTENPILRSQKKLSLVIIRNIIYFNNSSGDISAIDIETGELLWQTPTQSNLTIDKGFFLQTSDIITDQEALFFSNNKNEFFSLNINNGAVNWKQKINSSLRSTLIENYIFTVSHEGHLIIIEKKSGNIIRITDAFKSFTFKKRDKIKPTGFIVGKNNVYLTTDDGKLLVIDVNTGKVLNILKINKGKVLRPVVSNQNLYIATNKSIIKLN